MESGKTTKCMAMENYSILATKSDTKANSKMASFMALVLNMPSNKYQKDKIKLIRTLLDFIKEVGSNIKEGSKMIKDKDLEKPSSKMVSGLEISKMDSLMDMESGNPIRGNG